jgi:predicted nucleic acid-binding protein
LTVFDASVFVDALVVVGATGDAARAELADQLVLEVPTIFGAEVVSALSGLVRRGDLNPIRASSAVEQVRSVRAIRYPFEPLIDRAWELRDNVTVYDAWYVALAEWLGTDLVTADGGLVNATGPRCEVRLPRPQAR